MWQHATGQVNQSWDQCDGINLPTFLSHNIIITVSILRTFISVRVYKYASFNYKWDNQQQSYSTKWIIQ